MILPLFNKRKSLMSVSCLSFKIYFLPNINICVQTVGLRRYPRSEAKRYSRKRELQFQIQEDNSLQKIE